MGATEATARQMLLTGVDRVRPRAAAVGFPGRLTDAGGVPFPGAGPAVANLPGRNRMFTGRTGLMSQVYEQLRADGPAAVVSGAVHGAGWGR